MRGDLNDRLQRAQSPDGGDNTEKVILGVGLFMIIAFIAGAIAITIFVIKTMDKFMAADTSAGTTVSSESDVTFGAYGSNGTTSKSGLSGFAQNKADKEALAATFVYGTVSGSTYSSEFSGVRFTAPSDWILTSYSSGTKSTTTLLSPKDFSASSSNLTQSVIISYEAMSARGYSSLDDAMKTTMTLATSGQNNSLVNENSSANWGGNSFKGIVFKKTMDGGQEYFYETLFAQVNGYALKIQLQANSQSDLTTLRGMFK